MNYLHISGTYSIFAVKINLGTEGFRHLHLMILHYRRGARFTFDLHTFVLKPLPDLVNCMDFNLLTPLI